VLTDDHRDTGRQLASALIMRHGSTSSRLSTDKQLLSIPAKFVAQALQG